MENRIMWHALLLLVLFLGGGHAIAVGTADWRVSPKDALVMAQAL